MFDWIDWYRHGYAVGNTAWHLIGLFATWEQEGRVRKEYEDGRMRIIPLNK